MCEWNGCWANKRARESEAAKVSIQCGREKAVRNGLGEKKFEV